MQEESGSRTVKSVSKAADIIEQLRKVQGGTVSEVADGVDLSVASVHSHLATLKQRGYVIQHENTYNLGPQLLTLGEHVRHNSSLYNASKEQVEQLANESGECAHLITEHDGNLYSIYEWFGANAVAVEFHNNKRERPLNHLHCTASGKAILAELPEEKIDSIFGDGELPKKTKQTITNRETLLEELADIRERGHAIADEEQMQGIRAVGASIKRSDVTVEGAISVSGPASRLSGERFREELPNRVTHMANICEVNLQTLTIE
jgi:DNA-binding IclR family transcriptional regulator